MADPIYTNYPQTLQALRNKYQTYGDDLAQLPTPVVRSLANFDLQRVQRGQNPLSERETAQVVSTAMSGQAFTPEPEPSLSQTVLNTINPFAGRKNPIVQDIAAIGASIPRIPLALAREVEQLPELPQVLGQATRQADNPLEAVGNIAMSPGVRFIPGSYVAGNLLGGTEYDAQGRVLSEGSPGELVRHPLFTGLDVLPFAQGAAKATGAAKVEAAGIAALKESGAALYDIPRAKPIRTALTRQVNELGQLEPNRVGRVTQPIGEGINRTRVGQLGQEMFGRKYGRIPAAMKAKQDVDVAERMNPQSTRVGPGYDDDPLTAWNREARSLATDYADIPVERVQEITRKLQLDDLGDITDPRELEYVGKVKNLTDRLPQFGFDAGELGQAVIDGTAEIYPRKVANQINKSQQFVEHANDVAKYRGVDELPPVDDIVADIYTPFEDSLLSKKRRLTGLEARAYALHRQGYDVDALLEGIGKTRIGRMTMDELQTLTKDTVVKGGGPLPVERVMTGATTTAEDMAMVVQRLKSLSRVDAQVAKFSEAVRTERWTDAARHLRDIRSRSRNVLDDVAIDSDKLKEAIKRERRASNFMQRTEKSYRPERIQELEAYRTHLETVNVPARFRQLVDESLRERVKTELADADSTIATADVDEALRLADEGNFGLIHGLDQNTYRQWQTEARDSWRQMKADGIDPVFIHRTTPAQAVQLGFPRVLERELTPSQVKETMTDFTPWVEDATVGLEHAGMEWLIKRGSEAFIEEISTRFGVPERVLQERYLPAARAAAEINPALDVRAYMQELMKKEWTPYNPSEFVTWGAPRLKQFGDDLWVPKPLRRNLERMHVPPTGRLTQAMDPVMRVFRTSLLPLSPRWHVYNIIGGGMVTAMRVGPGALELIGKAYRMAKEGTLPEGVMHGYGMVDRDVLRWQATASKADKVGAAFHYVGGKKLREIWDSAQGARTGFNKFVQKSYDFNGFFDDFYRSMGYLYGKTKAERMGLSEAAAKTEGMMLTRKIMQNWDEITPLERTVMRYVFPFYGWMNHVMRYVASYPFDHPIRASVMAQFARNELEDMGTGLPQSFLNMFFVGDVDYEGKVKAINTAGMNPFSDVANYFTLAGFTGNVNPVISAVLTTLGVDTGRGAPTLYPNLQYDPQTGRLVAKNDSLVMNFAQAVVPQSRVLFAASGMSSEWKELLRRNPDAAGRMLASQVGIPIVMKDIPIYEEQFKGELARSDAQNTAVRDALKSGGELNGYPGLNAFMDQIRALQSQGQLADYTPQQDTPSFLEVAQQGLASSLNPR
jgi:hypothetical protein